MRLRTGCVLACGAITAPATAAAARDFGLAGGMLQHEIAVPGALPEPEPRAFGVDRRAVIVPVVFGADGPAPSRPASPDEFFAGQRESLLFDLIPTPGAGALFLAGAMMLRRRAR